jgi:hypothetical protein
MGSGANASLTDDYFKDGETDSLDRSRFKALMRRELKRFLRVYVRMRARLAYISHTPRLSWNLEGFLHPIHSHLPGCSSGPVPFVGAVLLHPSLFSAATGFYTPANFVLILSLSPFDHWVKFCIASPCLT